MIFDKILIAAYNAPMGIKERGYHQSYEERRSPAFGYTLSGARPLRDFTAAARKEGDQRALIQFATDRAAQERAEADQVAESRREKHSQKVEEITYRYTSVFRSMAEELLRKKHVEDRLAKDTKKRDEKREKRAISAQRGQFEVSESLGDEEKGVLPIQMQFKPGRKGNMVPSMYRQLLQPEGSFNDSTCNRIEVALKGETLEEVEIANVALHLFWKDALTKSTLEALPHTPRFNASLLKLFFDRLPQTASPNMHSINLTQTLPDKFSLTHAYYLNGETWISEECMYALQPYEEQDRIRSLSSTIRDITSFGNGRVEPYYGKKVSIWQITTPNPSGHAGYTEGAYQNLLETLLGLVHVY